MSRYKHERIVSPVTLQRRGKTKYRSKVTSGGNVLRIAFPPGRRRKGSGELQAILHPKGNPLVVDPKNLPYQSTDRRYLQSLGFKKKKIDDLIMLQRDGLSLLSSIYWIEKRSLKNPLTKSESANLAAEALVHSRIKGATKTDRAYYQGMADGMIDVVKQYSVLQKRGRTESGDTGREAQTLMKHIRMMNPRHPVKIYDRILEMIAVKGAGHRCDAACRRARHTYRHSFKEKASVFGNADGSLTIK